MTKTNLDRSLEDLVKEIHANWHNMSTSQQAEALPYLERYMQRQARQNFYAYVKLMAPLILPEGFKDGRHIKVIADALQDVEEATSKGQRRRLQIFLPPGAMKTKLSNLFVSWCLGRHPKWNVLHIGYSTEFATNTFSRPIRDLVMEPDFFSLFPTCKVKPDSKGALHWETTEGGIYRVAGATKQIAGKRAHIAICDDVVSEQTAYSPSERGKINKWYIPGLRTRLLPVSSEIIINTRWHVADLSGHMEEIDQGKGDLAWRIVKIPAILDKDSANLLGLPQGGSFWPEFWPLEIFEEQKATMPASQFNALYMQDPIPEEGNIFKEKYFRIWDKEDPPDCDYIVVSFDTAFSEKESADFSAYTVWGIFRTHEVLKDGKETTGTNVILLDADRGRWAYPDLVARAKIVYETYAPDSVIIEKKASGQSLIQDLRRSNIPVAEYTPDRDKITRAHAATRFFENGRVWFPKDEIWSQEVRSELMQVPFGRHDDWADTVAQAILWLRDTHQLYVPSYLQDNEDEGPKRVTRKTYWSMAS